MGLNKKESLEEKKFSSTVKNKFNHIVCISGENVGKN